MQSGARTERQRQRRRRRWHGFADVASENAPAVIAMSEIASGASPELVNVTGKVALTLIGWFANAAVVLEELCSDSGEPS